MYLHPRDSQKGIRIVFETVHHVAQSALESALGDDLEVTLNFGSFCFYLSSAGVTGVLHLVFVALCIRPRTLCRPGKHLES